MDWQRLDAVQVPDPDLGFLLWCRYRSFPEPTLIEAKLPKNNLQILIVKKVELQQDF